MFVEVILALGFLHLAFDARFDLLLDGQNGNFALHERKHLLKAFGDFELLKQLLLFRDFDREMMRDGIGQFSRLIDLADGSQSLLRNILVELEISLELFGDGADKCLGRVLVAFGLDNRLSSRLEEGVVFDKRFDPSALFAFDQHLDGAVGQLEQLKYRSDDADLVNVFGAGVVFAGVFLGHQENLAIIAHDIFESAHRFFAANKEWRD